MNFFHRVHVITLLGIFLALIISFVYSRNAIRQGTLQFPLRPPPWIPVGLGIGGLCLQNEIEKTKFRYFRYHNETKHCYHIDDQGPCNRNMQFYRVGKSDFGYCDCRQDRRCGRPLVYWKKTDSCFYVNTQGPCQEGQWLVYGLNKKPVCQRNPCLLSEKISPSNHKARQFWLTINGKCYRTRTRGFCPDPEEVLYFRDGEGYPVCVTQSVATVCHTTVKMSRPCWAGQKFDVVGKCRATIGFWGSEDDH